MAQEQRVDLAHLHFTIDSCERPSQELGPMGSPYLVKLEPCRFQHAALDLAN